MQSPQGRCDELTEYNSVMHRIAMKHLLIGLLLLPAPLFCQISRAALADILKFQPGNGGAPRGWGGGPAETISTDDKIIHGGKWSVPLERNKLLRAVAQPSRSAYRSISPANKSSCGVFSSRKT